MANNLTEQQIATHLLALLDEKDEMSPEEARELIPLLVAAERSGEDTDRNPMFSALIRHLDHNEESMELYLQISQDMHNLIDAPDLHLLPQSDEARIDTSQGISPILAGIEALQTGRLFVETASLEQAMNSLMQLWEAKPIGVKRSTQAPWFVSISDEFANTTKNTDATLRGQILEALVYISQNPTNQKELPIHSLSIEGAECWYYQIGTYRLVYRLDEEELIIEIIALDIDNSDA
jgi:mRNA-degrading endonuclease RelE of RelBE toxin-antitoxin system